MGGSPSGLNDDDFRATLLAKKEVLFEQWNQIDAQIKAIDQLLGIEGGETGTLGETSKKPETPIVKNKVLIGDNFHRMKGPKAILAYLKIVGKPAREVSEIVKMVNENGGDLQPTNVYTALSRLATAKKLEKVGDKWGLYEWYNHGGNGGEEVE